MPFDCQHRREFGQLVCLADCPTTGDDPRFSFARVEQPGDVPGLDPRTVDVAILDMHHGWPNLGHAAIVHALQSAVCDIRDELERADVSVRAISYDVRRSLAIPEGPGGRFGLYLGTGGPLRHILIYRVEGQVAIRVEAGSGGGDSGSQVLGQEFDLSV